MLDITIKQNNSAHAKKIAIHPIGQMAYSNELIAIYRLSGRESIVWVTSIGLGEHDIGLQHEKDAEIISKGVILFGMLRETALSSEHSCVTVISTYGSKLVKKSSPVASLIHTKYSNARSLTTSLASRNASTVIPRLCNVSRCCSQQSFHWQRLTLLSGIRK